MSEEKEAKKELSIRLDLHGTKIKLRGYRLLCTFLLAALAASGFQIWNLTNMLERFVNKQTEILSEQVEQNQEKSIAEQVGKYFGQLGDSEQGAGQKPAVVKTSTST